MAETSQTGTERFLTLSLGDVLFAIDILSVREILDFTEITRIPQTPEFMRGVVNVRGSAIPVMDLRMKFNMGRVERTLNTRIVILEIKRESGMTPFGVLADSVKEVLELDASLIDPPPRMGTVVKADFIRGIGKHEGRFILILDAAKVLAAEELVELAGILDAMPDAQPTTAKTEAEDASD